MDAPIKFVILILVAAVLIFIGYIKPEMQRRKANKAFNEIVDVMSSVSFDVSKYSMDQLQTILSRIAKKIYIPSWYTREDIYSLFMIHGIKIDGHVADTIFNELLENGSIVDTVTEALWIHVHKSLDIGE